MSKGNKTEISVTEVCIVTSCANTNIDNLFQEMGWERTHRLTNGDVREVISVWLDLQSNKEKETDFQTTSAQSL